MDSTNYIYRKCVSIYFEPDCQIDSRFFNRPGQVESWYTGGVGGQEQGFWRCFTEELDQS